MGEKLFRLEEVAVTIKVSSQTINTWYRWKRSDPDNKFAKLLPDYIQLGPRQTRFWNQAAVKQLKKFKESIPHGRLGIMGNITQKKGK